jgi:hypothetical protein
MQQDQPQRVLTDDDHASVQHASVQHGNGPAYDKHPIHDDPSDHGCASIRLPDRSGGRPASPGRHLHGCNLPSQFLLSAAETG